MTARIENIGGVLFKIERVQSRWVASTRCDCIACDGWHGYHDARTLTVLRAQVADIVQREAGR